MNISKNSKLKNTSENSFAGASLSPEPVKVELPSPEIERHHTRASKESSKGKTEKGNNTIEVTTEKQLHGMNVTKISKKNKTITPKRDESMPQDLLSTVNEVGAISVDEMKNAEAAAAKAVATATKTDVDKSDTQKPQASSKSSQVSAAAPATVSASEKNTASIHKVPRRKPGARECMQISRRFGANVIPQQYMDTLLVSILYLA